MSKQWNSEEIKGGEKRKLKLGLQLSYTFISYQIQNDWIYVENIFPWEQYYCWPIKKSTKSRGFCGRLDSFSKIACNCLDQPVCPLHRMEWEGGIVFHDCNEKMDYLVTCVAIFRWICSVPTYWHRPIRRTWGLQIRRDRSWHKRTWKCHFPRFHYMVYVHCELDF